MKRADRGESILREGLILLKLKFADKIAGFYHNKSVKHSQLKI